MSVTTDTPVIVHTTPGAVTILDCTGLGGQIVVGAPSRVGDVRLDAEALRGSLPLELGNDGVVRVEIYDVTGGLRSVALDEQLLPGSREVALPVSELSSGRYFAVVRSLGWRAIRPFVIDR